MLKTDPQHEVNEARRIGTRSLCELVERAPERGTSVPPITVLQQPEEQHAISIISNMSPFREPEHSI